MNTEQYEKMYKLEGSYWWFQGRLSIIESILGHYLREKPRPGRVLDVGCGTGLMLSRIAGWKPVGMDFSHLALEFCRERGLDRLIQADVVKLPLADESMDLVLALDMMEHVERDDLLIREFNRILRPGGAIMATVPAHPELWSDHDVALHHYRRYTAGSLRRLLRDGGFRPVKFSYAICLPHPGIVLFRKVQRAWKRSAGFQDAVPKTHLIPLPRCLNTMMTRIIQAEGRWLRRFDLPFGTSLVTLARKAGKPVAAGRG